MRIANRGHWLSSVPIPQHDGNARKRSAPSWPESGAIPLVRQGLPLSIRANDVDPRRSQDLHEHSRTPGLGGRVGENKSYCFLFSIYPGDQKTVVAGSEGPLFTRDLCAHLHINNFMVFLGSEVLLSLLLLILFIILVTLK